ncbi:hypothetical protein [Corallococcus sp. CA047B]|uniref:hypothetical protein n=1 Tax=Corallococcus sp. CA047B TaxID=2316729 RepID=UPI0018F4A573|nr:hypothetical protein [Corallococcus sp. CA047B]
MKLRHSILSLLVLSLATAPALSGCGSDNGPPTPPVGIDAGTGSDAGTESDAGTTPDAGTESDAGSETDAGTTSDAGTESDAGSETDAGTTPDAGSESDAGTTPDAGSETDAGTTSDAGSETDAGTTPDAGSETDAGTAPDAGSETDAGTAPDAGSETDAGTTPDAGSETDAGTTPDAGSETDAGTTPDAGSETDAGTTPDAGSETDAGTTPDAGSETDAGTTPDAGSETDAGTTPDAGTDPFTVCEGTCQDTAATIQMEGNQRVLTNAFFGYEEPSNPGDPWELYIELNNGTPGECPTPTSSVPPQLISVYALKVPVDATPQTGSAEGEPRATLVDLEGGLSSNYFDHSTNFTFTPVAASLCPTCAKAGTPPASHFVAFDVNGLYENGVLTGHGYATYCPSLDSFQSP